MEITNNNYIIANINDIEQLNIKLKKNTTIIYPIIKKKIIKNILSEMCSEEFQIRSSFYDFFKNNDNIISILKETFKIIKNNNNIIQHIAQSSFTNNLRQYSDTKNNIFKFSYINKIFSGIDVLDLFFYHNCFLIFLYYCNKTKESLNVNVFDSKNAFSSLKMLQFTNSFILSNN